jgi:NADP-dependent 3-hydroxy acid dehydrogenase YdfG
MKLQMPGHFINLSSVAGHKIRPAGRVNTATSTPFGRFPKGCEWK